MKKKGNNKIKPLIAFVHIEKNAGQTLIRMFRRSFGVTHCDVEPWEKSADLFSKEDFQRLFFIYPRLQSIAGHSVKPYSDLVDVIPNLMYVVFLRDPVNRCASHFQYQVQEMGVNEKFEEWILRDKNRNFQTRKIAGKPDVELAKKILDNRVSFVGVVEEFDRSMVMLKEYLENDNLRIQYQIFNTANSNDIKNELLTNPSKYKLLQEANRLDNLLYEHVTNCIWNRQIAAYGPTLEEDLVQFRAKKHPFFYHNSKMIFNRVKRNLLYKPALYCIRFFS